MKNAAEMSLTEFGDQLRKDLAPPEIEPMHPGHYQRKQRPKDAQKPFWSKRGKGKSKRAKA